jgi:hypothetical protein
MGLRLLLRYKGRYKYNTLCLADEYRKFGVTLETFFYAIFGRYLRVGLSIPGAGEIWVRFVHGLQLHRE